MVEEEGLGERLPTDAHRECSLVPVTASRQWHFAGSIRAWSVEDLVRMAMLRSVEPMRMGAKIIVRVVHCGGHVELFCLCHCLRREFSRLNYIRGCTSSERGS